MTATYPPSGWSILDCEQLVLENPSLDVGARNDATAFFSDKSRATELRYSFLLCCLFADIVSLPPQYWMCDSQWKGSQRKNKTKKPKGSGNNLDGCNPQNYCPLLKPLFTNVLAAVAQTLLMKVVLSNSGAVYSYSSTAPQHSSSQLVQVWWPLRTINTKLSKIKGDRTTGCE